MCTTDLMYGIKYLFLNVGFFFLFYLYLLVIPWSLMKFFRVYVHNYVHYFIWTIKFIFFK